MVTRAEVVSQVHDEWTAVGTLHDPPDDTSRDDDRLFRAEVERRLAVVRFDPDH